MCEVRRIAPSADQVKQLAAILRRIGRTSMRRREHLLRKPVGLQTRRVNFNFAGFDAAPRPVAALSGVIPKK